ncbi:MAG TPA: EAL domain-containing protein, partial [Jatrophihabitans sp.]|nr:EAL domain-containing protein [Jatrophihabitans sp.]
VVVVTENVRLVEQMRYQAFHDPLTGLSNRALFNDRLAHALELHRRDRRGLAVVLIDLDNFKLVNDSLGHGVGDELLIAVGERLRRATRAGDTVARLGGDEFAVLLESGGRAGEVAARVLADLVEPLPVGDRHVTTGASIGIAALDPLDRLTSAAEMLQHADIAMYSAKRAGKGLARAYSVELAGSATQELDMQAALLADLTAGRIDVAFQPVYDLHGEARGVETLARWRFRGEPVSPETFLAVARDLGCLNLLDEAVLRHAAAVGAEYPGLQVAVNVDRMTLAQPGFPARVAGILAEAGLASDRLVVEVLETDRIEQDPLALASLAALRDAGVVIAVDDFGAGYATLARLGALRPHVVKIDRSLVDGSADPAGAALLRSAAQLGRDMGADVVAEGIETPEQLAAVAAAGCDAVQGYLLSRPVARGELRGLVAAPVEEPA